MDNEVEVLKSRLAEVEQALRRIASACASGANVFYVGDIAHAVLDKGEQG